MIHCPDFAHLILHLFFSDCMVIMRTGWAHRYSLGAQAYLGYDESVSGPFDANIHSLSFPGIGADAADLMVRRGVCAVGVDTASLDAGRERRYVAHRRLLSAGVVGLENLSSAVDQLPARGAWLMVAPLKLVGGSGSPARIAAFLPKAV